MNKYSWFSTLEHSNKCKQKYDTFLHGTVSMLRHLNIASWEAATNVYQYRHFEMNVRVCRCCLWLRVMRRKRQPVTRQPGYRLFLQEKLRSTTCSSWKWFKRLIAFQCDVIWVRDVFIRGAMFKRSELLILTCFWVLLCSLKRVRAMSSYVLELSLSKVCEKLLECQNN